MIEETAGSRREHRHTLCHEIRRARISGLGSNLGAPLRQETPDFLFGLRIARGRRIRNPEIELKTSVALAPE